MRRRPPNVIAIGPQQGLPRYDYAAMGRAGATARWARQRAGQPPPPAPAAPQGLTPADALRGAVDAYARALVELQAAKAFAETAYWSCEARAIRRALRWVAAANVVADCAHDALLALGGTP